MTDSEESNSSAFPKSPVEAECSAALAVPEAPVGGDKPFTSKGLKKIPPPPAMPVGIADSPSARSEPATPDQPRVPTFPEEHLLVTTWPDPVLDQLGHDPRSVYVETFWLSILGPSCLLLLRRLSVEMEKNPDGFVLTPLLWAQELGLGMKGGKHGPFWRSIERASRFGTTQRVGSSLAVRRKLPPLTARQVERLPAHLNRAHHDWLAERMTLGKRQTIAKWTGPDRQAPPLATSVDDSHSKTAA